MPREGCSRVAYPGQRPFPAGLVFQQQQGGHHHSALPPHRPAAPLTPSSPYSQGASCRPHRTGQLLGVLASRMRVNSLSLALNCTAVVALSLQALEPSAPTFQELILICYSP